MAKDTPALMLGATYRRVETCEPGLLVIKELVETAVADDMFSLSFLRSSFRAARDKSASRWSHSWNPMNVP